MTTGSRPVLFVEDDDAIRELLRILLAEDGLDFVEADNGATALALAAELRPPVVVLDLRLPRVDGLEVARRLKTDPRTRACWIVGVSAHAEEATALAAGCDCFLPKPLDIAQLEDAVRAGLARSERALSPA